MNTPQGPQGFPGPPPQNAPQGPYQGPPPGHAGAPTTQFPPVRPIGPENHNGFTNVAGQGGPPPKPPLPRVFTAIWTLGLISLAATALGLTLKENGNNAWHSVHAWGAVAVLGAVLTITPAVGHSLSLSRQRAWQVAACGAGGLLLFWVLFVLPNVGSNTSLLTSIGVAAGAIAVWIAPGRDQTADGAATQHAPSQHAPSQHTW